MCATDLPSTVQGSRAAAAGENRARMRGDTQPEDSNAQGKHRLACRQRQGCELVRQLVFRQGMSVRETPARAFLRPAFICSSSNPENRIAGTTARTPRRTAWYCRGIAHCWSTREERKLGPWDYAHFPAGVSHVLVGDGDGPCAVLLIGHRSKTKELFYPESELARRHGAEAPEPTPDPKIAYADAAPREAIDPPEWPL